MKKQERKQVCVKLKKDKIKAIDKIAKQTDETRAFTIRAAIDFFINSFNSVQKSPE